MIRRLNQQFVCTTLASNVVRRLADAGDPFARQVIGQWEVPLVLAFFTPDGRPITKLSSLKELNQVHPQTTRRPEAPQFSSVTSDERNSQVFLQHLDRFFPIQPQP